MHAVWSTHRRSGDGTVLTQTPRPPYLTGWHTTSGRERV